jgi:NTP pyrophosphatase (non-canonical NTP hydrolase)
MNPENRSQLTIREAQQLVDEYVSAKGEEWTRLSNHHLRVTHLVEEVGELARAIINLDASYADPNRRGANQSRAEKLDVLRDSLGDILYHLFAISIAYGVDLTEAFEASMNSIMTRYPAASPTETLNPVR